MKLVAVVLQYRTDTATINPEHTHFCSAWRDQAVLFHMAEDARAPSFDVSISSVSSAIEISMTRGKSGERLRRNGASRVVNRIRGSCSKREQASSLIAQQFDTPVPAPCSLAADAGRSEGGAILVPICGWDAAGNVARKKTRSNREQSSHPMPLA